MKRIDIVNQRFGRLQVLEFVVGGKWRCRCDCSNVTYATGNELRKGRKQSCGCLRQLVCRRIHALHGHAAECMDERPEGKELSRIDESKGYEAGNVVWETHLENTLRRDSSNCGPRRKQ